MDLRGGAGGGVVCCGRVWATLVLLCGGAGGGLVPATGEEISFAGVETFVVGSTGMEDGVSLWVGEGGGVCLVAVRGSSGVAGGSGSVWLADTVGKSGWPGVSDKAVVVEGRGTFSSSKTTSFSGVITFSFLQDLVERFAGMAGGTMLPDSTLRGPASLCCCNGGLLLCASSPSGNVAFWPPST